MSWGWLVKLVTRRRPEPAPPVADIAEQHQRIQQDELRIAELAARQRRVIRENHLAPDIMKALKGHM